MAKSVLIICLLLAALLATAADTKPVKNPDGNCVDICTGKLDSWHNWKRRLAGQEDVHHRLVS